MTYKFPGTPAETKVAEFLVASTGGHFVTVVRPGVGELLGVSIRGTTVVIRDLLEVLLSAQMQEDAPSWKDPDIFHDAEGRN